MTFSRRQLIHQIQVFAKFYTSLWLQYCHNFHSCNKLYVFVFVFFVSVLKNVVGNYSCETKNPQFYGGAVIKVHMSSIVRHKMQ